VALVISLHTIQFSVRLLVIMVFIDTAIPESCIISVVRTLPLFSIIAFDVIFRRAFITKGCFEGPGPLGD
jgi:hypothetical protein